jgi:hypothetical protein
MTILNLGWVIAHDDIHQANIRRKPILLGRDAKPAGAAAKDPAAAEIARLAAHYLGTKHPTPRRLLSGPIEPPNPSRYLDVQLDTLKRMFGDMKGAGYRQNFKYIAYRSLHVMQSRATRDLGDTRIFKQDDIQSLLTARAR